MLLCTCFFLLSVNGISAQESNLSSSGQSYYDEGRQLLVNDDLIAAKDRFLQALEYFESNQDWNNWYKSINQYRKVGMALQEYQATYDSLVVWEKRTPESEHKVLGRIIFYQAYFLNNILGQQVTGLQRYKEAISPLSLAMDTNFLMGIFENLSYGYSKFGDQLSAIKYQEEAYDMARVWSKQKRICSIVGTLGKFYFHDNQYDKARETYFQALDLCENKDFTYLYLAELYVELDDLAAAKNYLALIDKDNPDVQMEYHLGMAQYYRKSGELDRALNEHELSFRELENYWDRRKYIRELVRYAEILEENGQSDQAARNAHMAICEFMPCEDSLDYLSRPQAGKSLSEIWIIEALYIKAKYFQNDYSGTGEINAQDEALFYYKYLFDLFDILRNNYYASGSSHRIGAYAQKIYADAIDFLFDLYDQTSEEEYFKLALAISQRANSYVLKNILSERASFELAGVSADSLDRYQYLSLMLKEQLEKDSLDDSYYNLSNEYETFKQSLEDSYNIKETTHTSFEISLPDIKKELKAQSALIKYFQHEDLLYAFVITDKEEWVERISLPENFDSLLNNNSIAMTLLNSFKEKEAEDEVNYLVNSNAIYKHIIGGILSHPAFVEIDHLIIVPDGAAKQVSFSTLVDNPSNDWTRPENYLVSKYAISYLNYCAQLKPVESKKHNRRGGFVGMGIEYETSFLEEVLEEFKHSIQENLSEEELRGLYLAPLRFATDEVVRCAKILNGEFFINNEVNPESILEKIRDRKIIHFSVHALVDEEDYLNSFILLNKSPDENFQLKYKDVLKENINSDLVVLSACQTGQGHQVIGEGLMSMTRAFIQSGSDATMGSYWNAPDKPTMEIMELFYTNMQKGMSKSKALQQAQLQYLNDDMRSTPLVRSPHFWGAWVIYGSDDSIQLRKGMQFWYLAPGVFLVVLIIALYLSKKKTTDQ